MSSENLKDLRLHQNPATTSTSCSKSRLFRSYIKNWRARRKSWTPSVPSQRCIIYIYKAYEFLLGPKIISNVYFVTWTSNRSRTSSPQCRDQIQTLQEESLSGPSQHLDPTEVHGGRILSSNMEWTSNHSKKYISSAILCFVSIGKCQPHPRLGEMWEQGKIAYCVCTRENRELLWHCREASCVRVEGLSRTRCSSAPPRSPEDDGRREQGASVPCQGARHLYVDVQRHWLAPKAQWIQMKARFITLIRLCSDFSDQALDISRPGDEERCCGTLSCNPERKWNNTLKIVMKEFADSGLPVLRYSSPLSRGSMKSKGGGRSPKNFNILQEEEVYGLTDQLGWIRRSWKSFSLLVRIWIVMIFAKFVKSNTKRNSNRHVVVRVARSSVPISKRFGVYSFLPLVGVQWSSQSLWRDRSSRVSLRSCPVTNKLTFLDVHCCFLIRFD